MAKLRLRGYVMVAELLRSCYEMEKSEEIIGEMKSIFQHSPHHFQGFNKNIHLFLRIIQSKRSPYRPLNPQGSHERLSTMMPRPDSDAEAVEQHPGVVGMDAVEKERKRRGLVI